MKTFHLIVIISLLFSGVTTTFGQKLKGKVKSYREIGYEVIDKFGEVKKGPKSGEIQVSYDQKGNVIKLVEYNPNGTISRTYVGSSNYNDNNIQSGDVFFVDGSLTGEMIEGFQLFIIESVLDSSGNTIHKMSYKNDLNGRPIEESIFDRNGRLLTKIVYKRDEKGNAVEVIDRNGIMYFTYDENGNKIENHIEGGRGVSYKYDLNGNEIEIHDYDRITTMEYQLDNHGNWVRQITSKKNPTITKSKPSEWTERKIEYYP